MKGHFPALHSRINQLFIRIYKKIVFLYSFFAFNRNILIDNKMGKFFLLTYCYNGCLSQEQATMEILGFAASAAALFATTRQKCEKFLLFRLPIGSNILSSFPLSTKSYYSVFYPNQKRFLSHSTVGCHTVLSYAAVVQLVECINDQ